MKKQKLFKLSIIAGACMTAMTAAQAGKIIGVEQAAPSVADGFGGWNLDNVEVQIVNVDTGELVAGKTYNETDGSYTEMTTGDTFVSKVSDGNGTVMGDLHGKDWPVGEPSGVKVLSSDNFDDVQNNGKPASCIMSTSYFLYSELPESNADSTKDGGWLDSAEPNPTRCDSPFQTHKRFKVDALPTTVDGAGSEGIDLVFNLDSGTVETDTRRYMILQKLNNYSDSRFSGFKIEVGFGVGADFKLANDAAVTAVAPNAPDNVKLSIGTGEEAWDPEDLAVFSAGLFGKADDKHPDDGFFDDSRAGYDVTMTNDWTIASTGAISTNYSDLFGEWIPSAYEPTGIFYDHDENPLTDAKLVAYWDGSQWLYGNADNFAPVPADQLEAWAEDESGLYSTGTIEDLLNLGLTYMVEVGDVSELVDATDNDTITIRLTPIASSVVEDTPPAFADDDVPELSSYEDSGSSGFSAYDNVSLMATVLGFLGLGALVARRKLSK